MSSLPQKLPGYPPLLMGESLASYLMRLGKANFYCPPSILTELILDGIGGEASLKDRIDFPRQVEVFERIARLAGIGCRQLYEASAHRFAVVLAPPDSEISLLRLPGDHVVPLLSDSAAQKQVRSTSACQYCPICVRQHPYHRLIWHLVATSVCLEHRCLLINQCYNCARPIHLEDIVNACCGQCGIDLGNAPSINIHKDQIGFLSQQIIQGWLLDTPIPLLEKDYLPLHPPRVLFRVIEGLRFTAQRLAGSGWTHLHTLPSNRDILAVTFKADSRSLTPYQSFCVYTTAFKGIIEWPKGFYEFLDAQHDQFGRAVHMSRMQKDFGTMYSHWFQRQWQHAAFDFVQDAFNLYIAERYGISPSILHSDRFRRTPELLRKFTDVSINYAAELAGVTPATIHRLINSGQLKTTAADSSFVRQADILRLRDTWNSFVGLEETTQALGLSEEVVLNMVDIGLLSSEQSPDKGFLSWKFNEKALCQFLDNIKKHAPIYKESEDVSAPSLNLVDASRLLTHIGLNAASLIGLVADGKLCAYRRPSLPFSCEDLLFYRKDIHAYIKTVLTERGWLSRKDVTRCLKIKDGTLARWVRTGLLTPAAIYVNAQYFDKNAIEKFVTDHITSEEAAKLLGIGVLAVQKWVRQERLQAVSGPGIDEHHNYLFNKEYLLQWRDGRLSFGEAIDLLGVSAATLHRWAHEGKIRPLDDMGGKQRWFSREAILLLLKEIEQKFAFSSDA
jgi:predicted site-specific integrase-resolvase